MAFLIEEKRCTSPTSSAQVSAVIGPTAGMVINRSTRSISNESVSSERTKAISVFLQTYHRLAAQPQQRTQSFIDVRVARQQFAKVPGLVQPLLVVVHPRFHQ